MSVARNIVLRIIQLFLQLAITLLIARMAHALGNGFFSLFITESAILSIVLGFSAESGIIFFNGKKQSNLSQVTTFLISIFLVQVIMGLLIYMIFSRAIGYQLFTLENGTVYYWMGAVYVFSIIFTNYFTGYNNSIGRFNTIIKGNILIYGLVLIYFILAEYGLINLPLHFLTVPYLTGVYVFASALNAIFLIIYTYTLNKEKIRLNDFSLIRNKAFKIYVTNAFIGNALQFMAYRMDVWFVNYYDSKHDLGNYALASKLAQFWLILPQFMGAVIFPLTASGHTPLYKFKKAILYIIVFNIASALVAVFMYPIFIRYGMKDDFSDSYLPFICLLPGVIIFSINTFLAAHLAGKGHVKINRQGSVICFIAILVLDMLLIPKYGIKGAAIASSIGYIICTAYVLFRYNNLKKNESSLADNLVP